MYGEITEKVDGFVTYLKHVYDYDLHSSYDVARRTVLLMREICSKTRYSTARYNARQKPELGFFFLDIRRKVPFYSKHLFIRFEFGPPWVYYIVMYMYMYECGIKSSKHSNHQWTLCRTSFLIQWGIPHKVHKTFKAFFFLFL